MKKKKKTKKKIKDERKREEQAGNIRFCILFVYPVESIDSSSLIQSISYAHEQSRDSDGGAEDELRNPPLVQ